jgi:hypothetical protein
MVACKPNPEFDHVRRKMRRTVMMREGATISLSKRYSGRLRRRVRLIVSGHTTGTGDVLGEPHPRLRQGQPKRLIVLVIRGAGHGHAFFRKPPMVPTSMILNDSHHAIPD